MLYLFVNKPNQVLKIHPPTSQKISECHKGHLKFISLLKILIEKCLSGLKQSLKPVHAGCSSKCLIKIISQLAYWSAVCANIIILNSYHVTQIGALEMSSICLCRPFQVAAQTCISGSPLITENKKDLANESPSPEHLVSNNLARAVTCADRLNIVKPMESVSRLCLFPVFPRTNRSPAFTMSAYQPHFLFNFYTHNCDSVENF